MITLQDVGIGPFIDTYDVSLAAEEAAEKVDCVVEYPGPNQLQLDLDSEESYQLFQKRLVEFEQHSMFGVEITIRPSKSGLPHRHVLLTLTDKDGKPVVLDEWQRIALQAVLGSDLIRETLNAWRLLRGEPSPSRLFRPKEDPNAGAGPEA